MGAKGAEQIPHPAFVALPLLIVIVFFSLIKNSMNLNPYY